MITIPGPTFGRARVRRFAKATAQRRRKEQRGPQADRRFIRSLRAYASALRIAYRLACDPLTPLLEAYAVSAYHHFLASEDQRRLRGIRNRRSRQRRAA